MSTYSVVSIIFNPNSTGASEDEAKRLAEQLRENGMVDVNLVATEYAGHATELAYELANAHKRPLIISSSGDGGYSQVVNGALRAQTEGATPVCGVLAAGNANDHSRTVLERPLLEAILSNDISTIDALQARIQSGADVEVRYAHSYIGLGLTPSVAVELNRHKLNRFKETYIAYKAFKDLEPLEIISEGRRLRLHSLIIANISGMAKVLKIATNAQPDDGQLKITIFEYRRKAALLVDLAKAAVLGVRGRNGTQFSFVTTKDIVMQLDGEVYELAADDHVDISVAVGMLSTVR